MGFFSRKPWDIAGMIKSARSIKVTAEVGPSKTLLKLL